MMFSEAFRVFRHFHIQIPSFRMYAFTFSQQTEAAIVEIYLSKWNQLLPNLVTS